MQGTLKNDEGGERDNVVNQRKRNGQARKEENELRGQLERQLPGFDEHADNFQS